MTETGFWSSIRGHFHKHAGHVTRVENTAGNGIPDIDACREGVSVKIELKVADGNRIHVQHTQRVWWESRGRAGGLCAVFVLVRLKNEVALYRADDLLRQPRLPGKNAKNFSIDLRPVLRVQGFPVRKPEWENLFTVMFKLANENIVRNEPYLDRITGKQLFERAQNATVFLDDLSWEELDVTAKEAWEDLAKK